MGQLLEQSVAQGPRGPVGAGVRSTGGRIGPEKDAQASFLPGRCGEEPWVGTSVSGL